MRVGVAGLLCAVVGLAQPPVGPESGMPYLATGPSGEVFLSWIEPLQTGGHALRWSKWNGKAWTASEEVARGQRWFVNWADFPAIAVRPDGTMLAHWLARPDDAKKYGYGIRVARREAATGKWREIYGVSLDEKEDYAGFLSFVPDGSGAVYLAPPASGGGGEGHRKTLRYVRFDQQGAPTGDREVDADVCSCCQTAVVATENGLLAAYRDHQPGEIRDISVVRWRDGAWTAPQTVHADGWKINGCPTDGPSLAAQERHVGVAWLTRAGDVARVQAAVSADGGATFQKPVRLDDGNPLGRPALAVLDGKNDVAVWLEKTGEGKAEVRIRRIGHDGRPGKSRSVASVVAARSAGFPKVAVAGDQVWVAWRDGKVRVITLAKQTL